MRGRVILLLLSSLLVSTQAVPQCNFRLAHSAQFRASYLDAAIDGNDLWTATGYGVAVFDRAVDPPRLVASAAIPGTTRAIDVLRGVAYVGSGRTISLVRRNGSNITISSSADAGATINDVAAASNAVYVATTNGLLRFDITGGTTLTTSTRLPTSSANVLSLARNGEAELFAADGDASVERLNLSTGAAAGAITSLPRSSSVSVAGDRVFVSDGQQTQIFALAGTPAGNTSFGVTTAAQLAPNVYAVAGTDRRYRVIDLALVEQPVELFAGDVIPTGGTINRVGAIVTAGGRVFVAGGDAGLVSLDISGFSAPYPFRSHAFGSKTSSVGTASGVFVGNSTGGITELTRFSSGALSPARTWATPDVHLVHDFANGFLLTSSGSTFSYWAVSSTPALVSRATLPSGVRSGIIVGSTALLLLEDRSIWTADLTRETPSPVRTNLASASFLERSARGFATAEAGTDGTTSIRFYSTIDATPVVASVPGVATALAFDEFKAAVFTFRGITVADFAAGGATTLLPQSNTALVRDLAIAGNRLLDVTPASVRVWDLASQRVIRNFALPAEGISLSLLPSSAVATLLTSDAVVNLAYDSPAAQPRQVAVVESNRYVTKLSAATSRLIAFGDGQIDVYETQPGRTPRHSRTIEVPGAIDAALSDFAIYVLYSNRRVESHSFPTYETREYLIDEGPDTVPRAIFVVHSAPWVAITRGCVTTGCEEKTLVLDGGTLTPTASLTGGVRDVAISGSLAFARMEVPPQTEIRTYLAEDALHPTLMASRAIEGGAVAVSVNHSEVLALGDRLYAYAQATLTKLGEHLDPVPVNTATNIETEGSCTIVTGRGDAAQTFTRSSSGWTREADLPLSGVAQGIVTQRDTVFILTDNSIEMWTRVPATAPARRRAAR